MFASEFRKVLKRFSDRTVFVDLFGGSGLLSHITKRERPDATVIYNDHDNYRERLENISRTNTLLSDLRRLSEGIPRHRMLSREMHGIFLERIRWEESTGFVDYLTISSSLLFSGKYARNIGELGKLNFYNNIRRYVGGIYQKDHIRGVPVLVRQLPVVTAYHLHSDGYQHIQDGLETYGSEIDERVSFQYQQDKIGRAHV